MRQTFIHKNKSSRKRQQFSRRNPGKKQTPARMKPEIAPALKSVLAGIGRPEVTPFVPDEFQLRALEQIKKNDCLVIAPTGSGKTWIAREAIVSTI
jgi:ATP-dependent RNA helicase HelY